MIISSNLAAQSAANDLSNTSAALAKSLANQLPQSVLRLLPQ